MTEFIMEHENGHMETLNMTSLIKFLRNLNDEKEIRIRMVKKDRDVICPYCKKEFRTKVPLKQFCCYFHRDVYYRIINKKERDVKKLPEHEQELWREYHGMDK